MTSNMGQQNILNTLCGRDINNNDIEQCTQNVMQQLRMIVAPEFINRIDNIVMFLPLTKKDIGQIAEINLKKEQKRLKEEKGITTIIEPSAVDFIVEHGYQPRYGGRPVKRAIVDYIINPLISELLNGTINKNLPIYILENNNKIFFKNVITPRI
jgi:ATP-dependent Clp protease ATP-binding subunit ClpB